MFYAYKSEIEKVIDKVTIPSESYPSIYKPAVIGWLYWARRGNPGKEKKP